MDNKVNWKQFWHYCFGGQVKKLWWALLAIFIMYASGFVEAWKAARPPLLVALVSACIFVLEWVIGNHSAGDAPECRDTEAAPQAIPVFLDPDLAEPYGDYDAPLLRAAQRNELLDLLYQRGARNDIVLLYGPSGCGKSHLLKLLVQGGEFTRNGKRVCFRAVPALEVQSEFKDIPCILAHSECRSYCSMLLIDQGERLLSEDVDRLGKILKDNLKDRKIIIAVTDTEFGKLFHVMRQLARDCGRQCASYYLGLSADDRDSIRSELSAACKEIAEAQKPAFAAVAYACHALMDGQIPLVQYRFIRSLFCHKDQMEILTEEGKRIISLLQKPEIAGCSFKCQPEELISDPAKEFYRRIENSLPISELIDKVTHAYFLTLKQIYEKDTYSLSFYEMLQFLADGMSHTPDDIALLTFTPPAVIHGWLDRMTARSLLRQTHEFCYAASHQWISSVFRTMSQRMLSGDRRDQVEAIIDRFPHYQNVLQSANKNYDRSSRKWEKSATGFYILVTLLLSGFWITAQPEMPSKLWLSAICFRFSLTLCLYTAAAFFINFIRYNACICKPAVNRLLFIPAIVIALFPLCAFPIPGCETLDRFWMVFLGIDNSLIGTYFLIVCRKRPDTARKHFLIKGIEFIAIGAALSIFGLLIGWWQLSFAAADAAFALQISLWAFPCAAYILLIALAIWNYCSPQFLPSLRLKACMLDNDLCAKQKAI